MPSGEQDNTTNEPAPRRSVLRSRRVAFGAAGLAVAAVAGVAVATYEPGRSRQEAVRTAAESPSSAPASSGPATNGPAASRPAGGQASAAAVTGDGSATTAPAKPPSLDQRLNDARTANERLGTTVRRPLPADGREAPRDLRVVNTGSLRQDGKSLRVVTARSDLTGQRELRWVADKGKPVGRARCSQNVKASQDTPAQVRPTLLFCWRTSSAKSVFTVAVVLKGRPDPAESVAKLNAAWNKL